MRISTDQIPLILTSLDRLAIAASLQDIKLVKREPGASTSKRSPVIDIDSSDDDNHVARPAKIVKREAVATDVARGPALSIQEQLRERNERLRVAPPTSPERDMKPLTTSPRAKLERPAIASTSMTIRNHSSSSSTSSTSTNNRIHTFSSSSSSSASSSRPRVESLQFPQGALRITRTPGRTYARNTTSLSDLISKDHLIAGLCYAFFIAQDELFRHLPIGRYKKPNIPIYIGRDPNYDPYVALAVQDLKMTVKGKPNTKQYEQLKPILRQRYKEDYGSNYHAFYGVAPGSAHSKLMALVYPAHLRIVISSCNWMDIDTVLGDNHFYIHDLPRRAKASVGMVSGFEADFLAHLTALSTPDAFLDSIRGVYDWSSVKVSLVTSTPGTHSGVTAESVGLLRLRKVIKDLDLKLPKLESEGKASLEVCAASIGNLNAKWLDGFFDCAMGRKKLNPGAADDECDVPKLKIVYPCVGDVKRAHVESQLVSVIATDRYAG